jgi:hypothetical protein
LHDAGKIVHPGEMSASGHAHEKAGRELLLANGVEPEVARFCETHARWNDPQATLEDLLVAAADKLWKGQREQELEGALMEMIARALGREVWDVYTVLDSHFEAVVSLGEDRLARSRM